MHTIYKVLATQIDNEKINFKHMNLVRSGIVATEEDYLYSSARNYSGLDFILEINGC